MLRGEAAQTTHKPICSRYLTRTAPLPAGIASASPE